jgi:hypothetical protein
MSGNARIAAVAWTLFVAIFSVYGFVVGVDELAAKGIRPDSVYVMRVVVVDIVTWSLPFIAYKTYIWIKAGYKKNERLILVEFNRY